MMQALKDSSKSYHFSKVYTRYFCSLEEDKLYYRIGLKEQVVNKRNCLVRPEIQLGLKDSQRPDQSGADALGIGSCSLQ